MIKLVVQKVTIAEIASELCPVLGIIIIKLILIINVN